MVIAFGRIFMMFLRDRRIVEATGTVGNVVAPCGEMSARITHIIMGALRIDKKNRARAYRNCVMFRCDQSVFEAAALPPVLTLTLWGHPEEVHGVVHLEPIVDTQ